MSTKRTAANQAAPKPLNLNHLKKRRAEREATFDFVLHATTDEDGNPTVVKAKLPSIFDSDTLAELPEDIRRAIHSLIEMVEQVDESGEGIDNVEESLLVENLQSLSSVIDAYVIAGFVEPRVYATAQEADDNDGAWVRDIDSLDRQAFFNHCKAAEGGAVADVAQFRKRQVSNVGAGSTGTKVSRPRKSKPRTADK